MSERFDVLVLAGGPDAEREVSLESARGVAEALEESGRCDVDYRVIDELDADGLACLGTRSEHEVVFPVLHGPWGEGGGIQRLLEESGRAFVGTGSAGAMTAMDKVRTKQIAAQLGIRVLDTAILDPGAMHAPPFALPVIVKPVCQGSSIGMRACRDIGTWDEAVRSAAADAMPMMIEPMLEGARELTVGLVQLSKDEAVTSLPLVEIAPEPTGTGLGLYDYEAKYRREDTRYTVHPSVPGGVEERVRAWTLALAHAIRVRHLCRADFLLDDTGRAVLLELNTMPGFTHHSLLPQAAGGRGISMADLCAGLVERAWRDSASPAHA